MSRLCGSVVEWCIPSVQLFMANICIISATRGIAESSRHAYKDDLTDLKICLYTPYGSRTSRLTF